MAEEAEEQVTHVKSAKATEKVATTATTEEVRDEFCPDEQYENVEKLTNENSDIFSVTLSDLSSKDEDILGHLKELLYLSMDNHEIDKNDKHFEIIKHERLESEFKVFIRVKFIKEVLEAVKTIGNDKIVVRKLPLMFKRPHPPSLHPAK